MIANPNDGNSPQVEVATPTISVSAGGLITATTQQGKGYVPGGSKSATQQLPTQGAKTVTPTTTEQIAVASGRYTTGDVKVAGDANLVAENIAEGVSIFGVTGTMAGGGSSTATVTIVAQTVSELGVYVSTPEGDFILVFVTANNSQQVQVVNNSFVLPVSSQNFGSSSQISGNAQIVDEIPLVAITAGRETRLVFVYGDCTITV